MLLYGKHIHNKKVEGWKTGKLSEITQEYAMVMEQMKIMNNPTSPAYHQSQNHFKNLSQPAHTTTEKGKFS